MSSVSESAAAKVASAEMAPGEAEPKKTRGFSTKQVVGLILGIAVCAGVWVAPIPDIAPLGQQQLALTLLAIIWWATSALPNPVTAALYMGALVVLGIGDGDTTFNSWTRAMNCWIVIAAFLIAAGVQNTGLGRRIAYAISTAPFVKDFKTLVVAIALLNVIFALIIPHSFARCLMILVVVQEICQASNLGKRDTMVLSFASIALCVPTGIMFLTSESAVNTIAANVIGGVSWFQWLTWGFVPGCVMMAMEVALFCVLFKPKAPIVIDTATGKARLAEMGRISFLEIKMVIWLVILVAFWLTCGKIGVSMPMGTLVLTAIMFIPGIGVLDARALKEIDAPTLIFITCTVAIGSVGAVSGMNAWISSVLLPDTFSSNPILIVLFAAGISMLVHMCVGGTLPTTSIMAPILLTFSGIVSGAIAGPAMVMIGYAVISSHYILSAHHATIITGMNKGGYTEKEVTRLGIALTPIAFLQALVMFAWLAIIGVA